MKEIVKYIYFFVILVVGFKNMFSSGISQIIGTYIVFFINQLSNTYLLFDFYYSPKIDIITQIIGICILAVVVGMIMYILFLIKIKATEGIPMNIDRLGKHGEFVNGQFKIMYFLHIVLVYILSMLFFTLEPEVDHTPTIVPATSSKNLQIPLPSPTVIPSVMPKLTGKYYPFFYLNFPDDPSGSGPNRITSFITVLAFFIKLVLTILLLVTSGRATYLAFELYYLDYNNDKPDNTFDKDKTNYNDKQYLATNSIPNSLNSQSSSVFVDYFKNINLQFLSNYKVDLGLHAISS
jgi:hypothetical protein